MELQAENEPLKAAPTHQVSYPKPDAKQRGQQQNEHHVKHDQIERSGMTSLTKVARDLWSEGRNATLTERTVVRDLIHVPTISAVLFKTAKVHSRNEKKIQLDTQRNRNMMRPSQWLPRAKPRFQKLVQLILRGQDVEEIYHTRDSEYSIGAGSDVLCVRTGSATGGEVHGSLFRLSGRAAAAAPQGESFVDL